MKKIFPLVIILLFNVELYAQISVQTVAYWKADETYDFSASYVKTKVKGTDTITELDLKYKVKIHILKETDSSYTVEWLYHDYEVKSGGPAAQILSHLSDSVNVVFTTNELGEFQQIENMDALLKFYEGGFNSLEENMPEITQNMSIASLRANYSNPVYIQNNSIRDLLFYYAFHGGKYDLKEEYNGVLETSNNLGGKPFSTDIENWLSEIDTENNTYVMRSRRAINPEQLRKATYEYLKENAEKNNTEFISYDEFPELTSETYLANRIHGSGWTTYMISTREVSSLDSKNTEEFILQMQ